MARGEAQIEHTRVEYLTKVDSIEEKVDSQCSPKKIQNSQHSLQLKNTMASKWDKYLCPDKTGERVELPRQLNDNMKRLEVINGTKDELYTKYEKSTRYFEKFDNDECLSENPSSKKIIKEHQEEKNVEHNLKHELETTVRQPVIKKPKTSENFSLAPKNSSSLISSALHKYKSRIKNKGSI
ncbi:hypothetical protein AX774_g2608 [Zancudomyces culisetae]|uniref:Uncharacterized protein n=1 Tax=Zancudomyces culisetae TaxID=1213189 RepID=A0A1R1PSF6_ZANCU|nr:hypothetical protein AX774_g2608 [Zancudomyces culisetae]|eukprot:OMH83881.1 hypothetical protein AX774_g2608 [Zancudomyces culisetae]